MPTERADINSILWHDDNSLRPELKSLYLEYQMSQNAGYFANYLAELFSSRYPFRYSAGAAYASSRGALTAEFSAELADLICTLGKRHGQRFVVWVALDTANEVLFVCPNVQLRQSQHEYLNYLRTRFWVYDAEINKKQPVVKLTACKKRQIKQEELPLQVQLIELGGQPIERTFNAFTINNAECHLKPQKWRYQLDCSESGCLNLQFLHIASTQLKYCYNLALLDISHTYIKHLDARYLIYLEELRLANTNVKRINLNNQGRLARLSCSYSLLDFVELHSELQLKELRVDFAGSLKTNRLTAWESSLCDCGQSLDELPASCKIKSKLAKYTVLCPLSKQGGESTSVSIPTECTEAIIDSLEECRKLLIKNAGCQTGSAAALVRICGLSSLETLDTRFLRCHELLASRLPYLVQLDLGGAEIDYVELIGLQRLQELDVHLLVCKRLKLNGLSALRSLDVRNINVAFGNITEFGQLRCLRVSTQEEIDLFRASKVCALLEVLVVINFSITAIALGGLKGLRELDVQCTNVKQLDLRPFAALTKVTASGGCKIIYHDREYQ